MRRPLIHGLLAIVLLTAGCFGGGPSSESAGTADGQAAPDDGADPANATSVHETDALESAFERVGRTGAEACIGWLACGRLSATPGENDVLSVEDDLLDEAGPSQGIRFNVTWSAPTEATSILVVQAGPGSACGDGCVNFADDAHRAVGRSPIQVDLEWTADPEVAHFVTVRFDAIGEPSSSVHHSLEVNQEFRVAGVVIVPTG